jgi:O-antigen/teichoic acid export membrane protein
LNFSEWIKSINYFTHLLRRGQYIFYTTLIEKIIFFIIFVILARKYSVSEYGVLTSVFVIGYILVSFFELGFSNYFQRRTASDLTKSVEEFNSAFTFRVITYFIILLIIYLYKYWDSNFNITLSVIIVTSLFIFNTNWLLIKIFYGLNEYGSVFKRFFVSRCILIVSAGLLILTDLSLTLFSMSFFISGLTEFILLAVLLKQREDYSFRISLKGDILKRIFASSFPMGLGIFFVVVYDRIDILLIQNIIGLESVSFYAVAYSFYKIPYLIGAVFLTPLYTDLSAEFELKKKIDYDRIKKLGLFLIIFCILSVTVVYFLSDFLIEYIYGEKYILSAEILKLLVIALPFLFLNNLTGVTLNSIRKEKLAFYSATIATLFNLLLNISLLNIIGIVGAVISTILTELLIFLIQLNYIMKYKFVSSIENDSRNK